MFWLILQTIMFLILVTFLFKYLSKTLKKPRYSEIFVILEHRTFENFTAYFEQNKISPNYKNQVLMIHEQKAWVKFNFFGCLLRNQRSLEGPQNNIIFDCPRSRYRPKRPVRQKCIAKCLAIWTL